MVQMNSVDGKLVEPQKSDTGDADYKLEMVELFKKGEISKARKLVCSQARPDEIEDIYKWLYDNIDLFGDEEKQESAILIIKQGLVDHTLVADPEINLAATLIRLSNVMTYLLTTSVLNANILIAWKYALLIVFMRVRICLLLIPMNVLTAVFVFRMSRRCYY